MAIGIIGLGYVGKATAAVFAKTHAVVGYDLKTGCWESCPASPCCPEPAPRQASLGKLADPIGWLVREAADAIFVCVPTPMSADGSCDISVVESVVRAIAAYCWPPRWERIVAIKSTVPPGTTARLASAHPGLKLMFCPEFLREATAMEDALAEIRVIIGATKGPSTESLARLYQRALPRARIHTVFPAAVAEMVKYATNIFLATKVSLANELCEICTALGINYHEVIALAVEDARLGASHWRVPGDGGLPGWGGSCFPKDLNALIFIAKQLGVRPIVMEAAWRKNLEVRPERDWERLVGRAVVASTPPPLVHSELAMGDFREAPAETTIDGPGQ